MRGGNLRRRSRTRHVLKWAGTTTSALLLVAWGLSLKWSLAYSGVENAVGWQCGAVYLVQAREQEKDEPTSRRYERPADGWQCQAVRWDSMRGTTWLQTWPWRLGLYLPETHTQTFRFRILLWTLAGPTRIRTFMLPFWVPLAPVSAATIVLWWRDRQPRFPANHCQKCGYNLTGNTSGRCPECGVAVSFRQVRRARARLDAWPVNWLMFCYAVGGVAVHTCLATFRPYYGLTVPRRGDPVDLFEELSLVWTTLWALLFLLRPITKQGCVSRRIIFIICMLPLGYGAVVTVPLLIRELASNTGVPSEPLVFMPVGYAACLYPLFSGLLCTALLVFVDRMVLRLLGPCKTET